VSKQAHLSCKVTSPHKKL